MEKDYWWGKNSPFNGFPLVGTSFKIKLSYEIINWVCFSEIRIVISIG